MDKKKPSFWLHHRDLNFCKIELTDFFGQVVRDTFKSENNGFLVISGKELPPGIYQLELHYDGEFSTLDVYMEFFYYYEEAPNVLRLLIIQ